MPAPLPDTPLPRPRRRRFLVGSLVVLTLIAVVGFGAYTRPAAPRSGSLTAAQHVAATTRPAFRIATLNIAGSRGADGNSNLARTADAIKRSAADVVALQEVHGESQLRQLADLTAHAAVVPTESQWFHDHFGNAILTRRPIAAWESQPLVGTYFLRHRNYVLSKLDIAGTTVHVLSTHIDRGKDNDRQIAQITTLFRSLPAPAILLADFNAGPKHAALAQLTAGDTVEVGDGLPEDLRRQPRIDLIFVRGLVVVRAGIDDQGASDHPLIWADLVLP